MLLCALKKQSEEDKSSFVLVLLHSILPAVLLVMESLKWRLSKLDK
jgi:hypothetical protein